MFTKLYMPSILLGSGDTTLREIELLEASVKGKWQWTNTRCTLSALKKREHGEKLTMGGGGVKASLSEEWHLSSNLNKSRGNPGRWLVRTHRKCSIKHNWEKSRLLRRKKNPVSLRKRSGGWNQDLGVSSGCLSFIVMTVRSLGFSTG